MWSVVNFFFEILFFFQYDSSPECAFQSCAACQSSPSSPGYRCFLRSWRTGPSATLEGRAALVLCHPVRAQSRCEREKGRGSIKNSVLFNLSFFSLLPHTTQYSPVAFHVFGGVEQSIFKLNTGRKEKRPSKLNFIIYRKQTNKQTKDYTPKPAPCSWRASWEPAPMPFSACSPKFFKCKEN